MFLAASFALLLCLRAAGLAVIAQQQYGGSIKIHPLNNGSFFLPELLDAPPDSPSLSDGPPRALAYYTSWDSDVLAPEDIPWNYYDGILFAFAMPTKDLRLSFGDDKGAAVLLDRTVAAARKAKKLVGLSIGGWTGGKYFSSAVKNSASRRKLIASLLDAYHSFGIDMIDLDWEYPGYSGAPGNAYSPQDSAHFLLFLKELRARLPSGALITAAVTETPFRGVDGRPLQDVSSFSRYLDLITVMNYDVSSGSSTPGPNAPMSDICRNSTRPQDSLAAAYNSWTRAGFPAHKLLVGLAAYGTRFRSSANTLSNRAKVVRSIFDILDDDEEVPFRFLVSSGVLTIDNDTTAEFVESGGFTREWDHCSQTPYIYSTSEREVVAYDDPQSLTLKTMLARETGMGGFAFWAASGDTPRGDLVRAARKGYGI
ncbi:hypothetical protein AX16_000984 [Volvariella volvacea WC 439]|nr:hypothetical protein AX16_000984 [Volvariella volvacea WC 439]